MARCGTPLMGDTAARILDLAGIVLNRNTIPGDHNAHNPSGVRLGTPWITQRGFGSYPRWSAWPKSSLACSRL